ncbi:hypothetical protein EJ02DRAFT_471283 [Clathrospora elynae]|uniref:Uncharacterized protein n=1 Tax=Clathrospora elynae TaxID=706981 RepID=A0A6A5S3W0_9PLEO|nr:hypothetical protein EJ02DRAFT_471283 [Clathrospora elynae]
MTTIAHNGTINHAGIPNPNFVADSDIPRYAAIRFPNCVLGKEAQKLLDQVEELKNAKMPFKTTRAHGDTFLQAWIGLWRKYSSAPFVSAGPLFLCCSVVGRPSFTSLSQIRVCKAVLAALFAVYAVEDSSAALLLVVLLFP